MYTIKVRMRKLGKKNQGAVEPVEFLLESRPETVKELVEGFCKRYKGELEEAVVMENMNGALATAFTMQLVNAPEETLKELYETEQLTPEMKRRLREMTLATERNA